MRPPLNVCGKSSSQVFGLKLLFCCTTNASSGAIHERVTVVSETLIISVGRRETGDRAD